MKGDCSESGSTEEEKYEYDALSLNKLNSNEEIYTKNIQDFLELTSGKAALKNTYLNSLRGAPAQPDCVQYYEKSFENLCKSAEKFKLDGRVTLWRLCCAVNDDVEQTQFIVPQSSSESKEYLEGYLKDDSNSKSVLVQFDVEEGVPVWPTLRLSKSKEEKEVILPPTSLAFYDFSQLSSQIIRLHI